MKLFSEQLFRTIGTRTPWIAFRIHKGRMLIGGMVSHKIEYHTHVALMSLADQQKYDKSGHHATIQAYPIDRQNTQKCDHEREAS
jgi:hypothetical protein